MAPPFSVSYPAGSQLCAAVTASRYAIPSSLSPMRSAYSFSHDLSKHRVLRCDPSPQKRTLAISAIGSSDSQWEREEQRWIREEQRWLREEQRWLRQDKLWEDQVETLNEEKAALQAQVQALQAAVVAVLSQAQAQGITVDVSANVGLAGSFLPASPQPQLPPSLPTIEEVPSSSASAAASALASRGIAPQAGSIPDTVTAAEIIAAVASRTVDGHKQGGDDAAGASRPAAPPAPAAAAPAAPAPAAAAGDKEGSSASKRPLRTLRCGCDGEDVKQMQEALEALGFYCGEEDMEYEVFADGTESAVKTWQCSMGLKEDGVLTPTLLAMLLQTGDTQPLASSELVSGSSSSKPISTQGASESSSSSSSSVNGSAKSKRAPSATKEHREIERYARSSLELGQRRVFLLGEQRWEDPDRMQGEAAERMEEQRAEEAAGINGVVTEGGGKWRFLEVSEDGGEGEVVVKSKTMVAMCFQCRGEGTVVCMECEGTGDLNVEEQFADWVAEGANCLYCDGSGALMCDACHGAGKKV